LASSSHPAAAGTLSEPGGHPDFTALDFTEPSTFVENDMSRIWHAMRHRQPVYLHPENGSAPAFWMLTRYEDIVGVYRDSKRFTSERGNVLQALLAGQDSGAGRMLAVTDGSRHTELRSVLSKAFAPRNISYLADRIKTNTRKIFEGLLETGQCDIAHEIAEFLPMNTICDLLGVPEADRAQLLAANQSALSSQRPDQSALDSQTARNDIVMYFADLAARMRRAPGDNVIGVLVSNQVGNRPLSDIDIALNCYSLVLGGDETSRLSIISAVLALIENPDQWARLRRGEVDLDLATEEVLRWASPTMHFGRRALEDVTVGGQKIRAGDIVTLWNASANRDEEQFTDPGVFDLGRTANKHVSFGMGRHFCIGSALARVEIRAVLEELGRFPYDMRLDGVPAPIYSNFLNGYCSLPVTFTDPQTDARP